MSIILSESCEVKYKGSPVKGVQSASIQVSNSLEPVYGLGSKLKYSDAPTSFLTCSAELSYMICGSDAFYVDILKIANAETDAFAYRELSIGGLVIEKAWLTSWQVSGGAEGMLEASASFIFFEEFDGDLAQVAVEASETPITFAQGMFSSGAYAQMPDLFNFSYSINVDMEPISFIGEPVPTNMIKRRSTAEISLDGANIAPAITLCGGADVSFSFDAKDCAGEAKQNYALAGGKLTSRNFEASANDIIRGSAGIIKNF